MYNHSKKALGADSLPKSAQKSDTTDVITIDACLLTNGELNGLKNHTSCDEKKLRNKYLRKKGYEFRRLFGSGKM